MKRRPKKLKMLSGRLAWVTGGGRGIGQAVSQILAREGARVIVSDLNIDSCHETLKVLKVETFLTNMS